ncbi:MAG: hypothetical protein HON83_09770 [Candidatus Marinimicrobia bacterium]|jgi:hypothetical protein|nr:hypothetical protein [Candidatus Neomarinimicrobiota bacterium]MBT6929647.1 hypothetical protein [Candidatus Neomarinimicrobiota bacterium]
MDEKTIRALIDAGAIKQIEIIASGGQFHIKAKTPNDLITAHTAKGSVKS